MTLQLRGGQVLRGQSPAQAAADVLIQGERIAAVRADLPRPDGAEAIDATGCLVLPGLVNAHTHGHNNLLRGLAGRWTLEDLLNHGPALNAGRTNNVGVTTGVRDDRAGGPCSAPLSLPLSLPLSMRPNLPAPSTPPAPIYCNFIRREFPLPCDGRGSG